MAMGGIGAIVAILGIIAGTLIAVMIFMYVLVPLLKGIGWGIGKFFWLIGAVVIHVFRYLAGTLRDTFRAIGAVPAAVIFAFLAVGSVVIGRWSASAHFASNMQKEVKNFVTCIYRVILGHPLRLIGLHAMLEGIEQRVPAAMAEIPGADKPSRRTGKFEGYEIVGSLPGGGSGGRLYIAKPNIEKRGRIAKAHGKCPERVVIKSFAVADGSSIPQIVRESRALEAAKQLSLILDHELEETRFHYVMAYVPGESLGTITRDLHTKAGNQGLRENEIRQMLGYLGDVLTTLDTYHRAGLWHKDIKPENIIVSDDGCAHVVDLGLVTPLRSAMTLTTHGTEYFRDPEMVRMALKGVKVNEVDGTKFDLYAAGAVLFHLLENTFPSHGGLSTISKPCPDAVKWIVRRAMTDYSKRYESAAEMYEDLKTVATHPQMAAMKPIDLPSLNRGGKGGGAAGVDQDLHAVAENHASGGFAAHAPLPAEPSADVADQNWPEVNAEFSHPDAAEAGPWNRRSARKRYRFNVTNWWTGAYVPVDGKQSPEGNLREELHRAKDDVRPAVKQAPAEIHQHRQAGSANPAAGRGGGGDEGGDGGGGDGGGGDGGGGGGGVNFVSPTLGSPRPQYAGQGPPLSAATQVARARGRANELRRRARERANNRKSRAPGERVSVGMVVAAAFVAGVVLIAIGSGALLLSNNNRSRVGITNNEIPTPPQLSTTTKVQTVENNNSNITETWSGGDRAKLANLPNFIQDLRNELSGAETLAVKLRKTFQIEWPEEYPARFIIVNDHPQPGNEKVQAAVTKVSNAITNLGLQPVFSEEKEALVRARVSQYLSGPYAVTPGSELNAAEQALSELMQNQLATVGGIIWLAPIADQPDTVRYWVITPDAGNSTLDDRILSYLQKIIN